MMGYAVEAKLQQKTGDFAVSRSFAFSDEF
jgi:hypothetical protein